MVVGDPKVGKTCSVMTFCDGKFPHEYVPTVYDNWEMPIVVEGREVTHCLWDSTGWERKNQGSLNRSSITSIKPDIFLLMFSVMDVRDGPRS